MEDLDTFLGGWGRDGTISTASSSLVEFHILDSLATSNHFPHTKPTIERVSPDSTTC